MKSKLILIERMYGTDAWTDHIEFKQLHLFVIHLFLNSVDEGGLQKSIGKISTEIVAVLPMAIDNQCVTVYIQIFSVVVTIVLDVVDWNLVDVPGPVLLLFLDLADQLRVYDGT